MWGFRFLKRKSKNPELVHYLRKNFGFIPSNLDHYEESLRHSSASFLDQNGHKVSNERLEYLGDAILDAIIAEYLFHNFRGLQEGQLTKMKAKVVSRQNLNAIGLALYIQDQLVCNMGKQDLHHSIIGNAFEAMIGAVYLDKGYAFTKKITIKILEKHGLNVIVHEVVDFKSKLHEWSQKKKKKLHFKVLEELPEQSEDKYKIGLYIDNILKSEGTGPSKKLAEQEAAKIVCKNLFDS